MPVITFQNESHPQFKHKIAQLPPPLASSRPVASKRTASSKAPCRTCNGGAKRKVQSKPQGVMATAVARLQSLKDAAVDFVKDGMHIASDEQQQSRLKICKACPVYKDGWCDSAKGGCGCNLSLKVKARAAYCPLGKWFAGSDNPRPLVNPVRSLAFHLYAKRGAEWNWHNHIQTIKRYAHVFNGKIVIGITYDPGQDPEHVKSLFDGVNVSDWIVKPNGKLAETLTHVEMLERLQTTDPNALIFRMHSKGCTKQRGSVEQRWAEIMWDANMDLPSVDEAMRDHNVACILRSMKPLVSKKPGSWFPAGSAYWMRAKEVFERDWRWTEDNRWIVEYVPSHLFDLKESACIFHDQTDSPVLSQAYFSNYVEPEYTHWRFARGIE